MEEQVAKLKDKINDLNENLKLTNNEIASLKKQNENLHQLEEKRRNDLA